MDIWQQSLIAGLGLSPLLVFVWRARSAGRSFRAGWKQAGERKALERMERLALTPQHSIHLVRFRDRYLLIGVHGAGFSLLSGLGASDPIPGDAGTFPPEDAS